MKVELELNPKHENYMLTAFYEYLASSGHKVRLLFGHDDLLDADKPASLDNLSVSNYHMGLVHSIDFVDQKGKRQHLHSK